MPHVDQIISGLKSISDDEFTCDNVYQFLADMPVEVDSIAKYFFFSPAFYTRNLIYKDDRFEMMTICWEKGQVSRVHDHSDQKCWMTVPVGRLKGQNFAIEELDESRGYCRLRETDSYVLSNCEAAKVELEEPIHQILNLAEYDERAVSLHIYSRPYDSCLSFCLDTDTFKKVDLCYTSIGGKLCDSVTLSRMKYGRQLRVAAFALVVALYTVARFWDLTQSCLWFDEIFSVHAAEHSWNSILSFVSLDLIHPPLFYVLLKLWIGAGGESLFWLRLFPVVFSIVAVFPFVSLCRELKLEGGTQMLALFLLAVNGSLIKYAQEVRMYSLLMCLSLFSIWLFARYFIKGKSFIPLVIVNLLMVYTHYFGWFVVFSEVVLVLWFQRIKWRRIMVMFGMVAAGFVPWVVAVWQAASAGSGLGQNIGWMSRPGTRQIITFVFNMIEPFYFQTSSAEPISVFRITVPLLLVIVIAAIVYVVNWQDLSDHERKYVNFLLLFIKLPVVITFIASWILPYSMWGTRHLIVVFAAFCVYVAIMLTSRSLKWLTAAVTLVILFAGYAFVSRAAKDPPQNSWCAWEPLVNEMILTPDYSAKPRTIYAFEHLVGYHIWFAGRKFPNLQVNVVKDFPGTKEDAAYFLPRGFDEVKLLDPKTAFSGSELWIAFRDPDPDHDKPGISFFSNRPQVLREMDHLGYEAVDAKKTRVDNESVFLVKLVRTPQE